MEREVLVREQKEVYPAFYGAKMRIAVCDGNHSVINRLKSQIYKYAENNRMDILVEGYLNGEELIKSKINYNVIFLGYKLKGKDGLEIARIIRDYDSELPIIFATNYTDFVFDAFEVSPFRFLITPISNEKLYSTLDNLFKTNITDCPLFIKSRNETVFLKSSDIVYLEADNKRCFIHLCNEKLPCNKTMAKVSAVLPKKNFIKINRAFIVNYKFIEKFNNDVVYLKNNIQLHISRHYYNEFREKYDSIIKPIII